MHSTLRNPRYEIHFKLTLNESFVPPESCEHLSDENAIFLACDLAAIIASSSKKLIRTFPNPQLPITPDLLFYSVRKCDPASSSLTRTTRLLWKSMIMLKKSLPRLDSSKT